MKLDLKLQRRGKKERAIVTRHSRGDHVIFLFHLFIISSSIFLFCLQLDLENGSEPFIY